MGKIVDGGKEGGMSGVIGGDVGVMGYCNEVGEEVEVCSELKMSKGEGLKFY